MVTMMGSNISYSCKEALHHFKRNWSTVLGAVVTIFLSLFIIGLFLLGGSLVNNLADSVEDKVTIQGFLSDSASQDTVDQVQATIKSWSEVESVSYKSKDEALEEYKNSMGNKNAGAAVEALDGQNPLPASIVVKCKNAQDVPSIAEKIAQDQQFISVCDNQDDPADSVQYGQETVERLNSLLGYVRVIAAALVVLLIFVAFVFINNTIRLAIAARRREIAIMRLVGASNGFIRGPFIMEGILEALIGAALTILVLQLGISTLLPMVQNSLSFLPLALASSTVLTTYAALLVMGVVIGFLGSLVALRRFLKV